MKTVRTVLFALALVTLVPACSYVTKQAPPEMSKPATPAPQTPSHPKAQLLFVQNAKSVVLKDTRLYLKGVSPATIFISDRPERITGHMPTRHFISLWNKGADNFTADPPKATLSVLGKNSVSDTVMELYHPLFKYGMLVYEVKVLQGAKEARGGACSLFIDAIAEPLTPDSFNTVNRRMYLRGADGIVAFDDNDGGIDHMWKDDVDDHLMDDDTEDNEHNWGDQKQ